MKSEHVNDLLVTYKNDIPHDKLISLKRHLENLPDKYYDSMILLETKNPQTILILSIFFGTFGVDRYMIGDIILGIFKPIISILTFFIFPLIDVYYSYKRTKYLNYINIIEYIDSITNKNIEYDKNNRIEYEQNEDDDLEDNIEYVDENGNELKENVIYEDEDGNQFQVVNEKKK